MEAAAPEAAEPQATAEPQAEPRQRSWRRVKVPTSVVVTLVGIALTAWLLPAFTRQWDDRQKARELKAGLASDMGKSTATVLYQASASSGAPRNVVAQSLVSQADIASRLRLYFPPSLVSAWQLHSLAVNLLARGPDTEADLGAGLADVNAKLLGVRDPVLAFDPDVRRVIYTTNAIEALNRQLRKAIKTMGASPPRMPPASSST